MKYVTNKEGEVKVMRKDGTHKFIAKHLAENQQLLKDTDLEIVYEHEFITGDEPVKEDLPNESEIEDLPNESEIEDLPNESEIEADFSPTDLTQESKTKTKQKQK